MSHRFVKENYGCHCFYQDSSFKRYNRAHLGGDTLIFNFNNCCGGYIPTAHGSFGFGGFWGGLGAGLGMGLLNMGLNFLGGWLGGTGNWFGGMGGWMNNGGWMNDGGWMNNGGWFGGNRLNKSGKTGSESDNADTKNDIDNPKISKLSGRVTDILDTIKNGGKVDKAELDKLKADIQEAKDSRDSINKYHDGRTYDNLLKALDTIDPSKIEDGVPAQGTKAGTGEGVENGGATGGATGASGAAQGAGDVDYSTYDAAGINKLDDKTIKNLSEADLAKLLNTLGANIRKCGDIGECITLPKTISVDSLKAIKKIADARNLKVAVANNPKAGVDQWIAGKIDDIKEENGKISYTVDCTGVGKFGYKYTVEQTDTQDKWDIDLHSGSVSTAKEAGYGHKKLTFTLNKENVLSRNSDDSVVSKKWSQEQE